MILAVSSAAGAARYDKERLREEGRRRTIVVVGIVNPVRVELELAIVEVEVRRLVEVAIDIRISVFARPCHRNVRRRRKARVNTSCSCRDCGDTPPPPAGGGEAHLEQRQAVSPHK